jgi:glutathione peroxidase
MLPFVKHLAKNGHPTPDTKNSQAGVPTSFYQLSSQLHDGQPLSFASLKGKQVLLVNVAPNATNQSQYQELQQLAAQFVDELVVLAFPTSDFAEPAMAGALLPSASATTPISLMQPSVVIKTAQQHPVYQWLSTARQNGWNEQAPPRSFTKYLVNSTGQLAHYFGPTLSPLSETVIESIKGPAL